MIEIEGRLLGKPEDLQEAEKMLRHLRGRCHLVHTSVTILQHDHNVSIDFVETAQVWFKPYDEMALKTYLDTGESFGKAGAYSIQGKGAQFIEKIEGDYPTIVGLPLWRIAKVLEQQGVDLPTPMKTFTELSHMRIGSILVKRGFAPADEVLLFRQKDPKPCSPVHGLFEVPSPPSRNKMARKLATLKQPSPRC